jgi:hypothetical protein
MPSGKTTWLIIEPTIIGHHFTYLNHIVVGALARGIGVIIGVGTDKQGDEIVSRIEASFPAADVSFARACLPAAAGGAGGIIGLIGNSFRWRRFLAESYRAAAARRELDFVLVPYLDFAAFAIGILGSPFGATAFGGLTMRQRFHFPEMGVKAVRRRGGVLRKWLFVRLLKSRHLDRILVIDDTLQKFVARHHGALTDRIAFMPDPSDPVAPVPVEEARAILGLPSTALVILLYGYIDARKGVATLLEWAAGVDGGRPVHVVLAGTIGQDAEHVLAGGAGAILRVQKRLTTVGRYITPEEERVFFGAADLVWLGYEDFDLMSGVLVKAAQYRRGILFRDYGLIGRFAKRHGSTPGATVQSAVDAIGLPEGIEVRSFQEDSPAGSPLPDHSWESACRIIFDRASA